VLCHFIANDTAWAPAKLNLKLVQILSSVYFVWNADWRLQRKKSGVMWVTTETSVFEGHDSGARPTKRIRDTITASRHLSSSRHGHSVAGPHSNRQLAAFQAPYLSWPALFVTQGLRLFTSKLHQTAVVSIQKRKNTLMTRSIRKEVKIYVFNLNLLRLVYSLFILVSSIAAVSKQWSVKRWWIKASLNYTKCQRLYSQFSSIVMFTTVVQSNLFRSFVCFKENNS